MQSSITNELKPAIRCTLRYCPSKIRTIVHVPIKLNDHFYKNMHLHEKVMQFYKESKHKSKTCKLFNIARTTLDNWILLEQQTGQLEQPKSSNMGRPSCILDLQAFEAFVKTTPFTQAKDLVPLFALRFGYSVSDQVILGALNRIGWTRKKRVFSTNKPAS